MNNSLAPSARSVSPRKSSGTGNIVVKVFDRFGQTDKIVSRRLDDLKASHSIPRLYLSKQMDTSARQHAEDLHHVDLQSFRDAYAPAMLNLEPDLSALVTALEHDVDEPTLRGMLAMMLEALPAASSQISSTYIDAIVMTLRRAMDEDKTPLSGYVLCRAIRRLWLTERFAPGIGDVVEAVRTSRDIHALALTIVVNLAAIADGATSTSKLDFATALAARNSRRLPDDDEEGLYDRGL